MPTMFGLVPTALFALSVSNPTLPEPPPVVEYELEVRVEPDTRRLHGSGTLRFRNSTKAPADRLCFHLYLNAFRNEASTFMRELSVEAPRLELDEHGFVELLSLEEEGAGSDLLANARYISPDDGRPEDRTVLEVPLKSPLDPGADIELELSFVSQLPKPVARAGAIGGFMMAAQWYPKLGVLEPAAGGTEARWSCHQYHAIGEFFAPFGRYRVTIDVPDGHEVGATGPRVEMKTSSGRTRHVHQQDKVHDFAFVVDPRLERHERRFEATRELSEARRSSAAAHLGIEAEVLRGSDVKVILLIRPERRFAIERYFTAAFHALRELSLRFGPYPYSTLTVVDPPPGAGETGGMEYPTLITAGARFGAPASMPVPESVTIHEIGHQFFYGLVGTNEVQEAWLDEGLTSYATLRVYEQTYGRTLRFAPSLFGVPLSPWFVHPFEFREIELARLLSAPDQDPTIQPSWMFRDLRSYRVGVYARPVRFFMRLEQLYGAKTLDRALYRYAVAHRYGAPRSADLLRAIEAEAHGPLPEWVTEPLFRPGGFELAVSELVSRPVPEPRGIAEVRLEADRVVTSARTSTRAPGFFTTVVVERRGEMMRPAELLLTLEDGAVLRHKIKGRRRWWRFEHQGPRAVKAELFGADNDPLNQTQIHRARRLEAEHRPAFVFAGHSGYVVGLILDALRFLL